MNPFACLDLDASADKPERIVSQLLNKVRPKDYMEVLRAVLPDRHSPLQASGSGIQSIYLTELSPEYKPVQGDQQAVTQEMKIYNWKAKLWARSFWWPKSWLNGPESTVSVKFNRRMLYLLSYRGFV